MRVTVQFRSRVQNKSGDLLPLFYFRSMYFTYILHSENYDRYYTGHCEDLQKRLQRHNSKLVTSTKRFAPWKIVYFEIYPTKLEANMRELEIKKMKSRKYIESLIKSK